MTLELENGDDQRKHLSVRLEPELYERLKALATERKMRLSKVVAKMISYGMDNLAPAKGEAKA